MAKIWRFEVIGLARDGVTQFMTTQHYQTDLSGTDSEASAATILDKVLSHYSSSAHNLSKFSAMMDTGSKLTRAVIREELLPSDESLPETAEELLNVAGTRSFTGDALPTAMCVWVADKTGVASRSARGGSHVPPAYEPALLTAGGQWDAGTTYWTAVLAYATARADGIENAFGLSGLSDIEPVVYSRTRRIRTLSPFTFDYESCLASVIPRWLRRREPRSS